MANPNWIKGGPSPNPSGRQPSALTWQKYSDRVSYIIENYEVNQILDYGKDVKKLSASFSQLDAIIVLNLYNIYTNTNPKERERLLDRLLGKAVQKSETQTVVEVNHVKTLRLESLDDDTLQNLLDALQDRREPEPVTIENHNGLDQTPTGDSKAN